MLAVAGLRSLYGVVAGVVGRLVYLRHGLGSVLLFVAGKMLLHDLVHVPTPLSLIVIVTTLATAAGASLLHGEASLLVRRLAADDPDSATTPRGTEARHRHAVTGER